MVIANPNDTELFKSWLITKSRIYSEADSEMLSDYIIALLELDLSPEEHISNLNKQLSDFTDNAKIFSQEIVSCLVNKSYILKDSPIDEKRLKELAVKQRILQMIQEKKLHKQREQEIKDKIEEEIKLKSEQDRLRAQEQRITEEKKRLEEEHIKLKIEQEERQKQFMIKQQKKNEMVESLEQMIKLKEKMLDEYDEKLSELQEILLSNPNDHKFIEEVKIKFILIKDEMSIHHVTPEEITQDRIKLEKITNSTSMLSTRCTMGKRGRGGLRGGIQKPAFTRNSNTSYNRKLDLRTRTLCFGIVQKGQIHTILEQLDMDRIECTKNDEASGFNVTFKDRFYAEQIIKKGIVLNGTPLALKWNELIRPGLGSLNLPSY